MAKIRLNLNSLSVSEKIAKALQIVAKMTGNAPFATPSPALATVTTAANELKTATDDVQAVRQLAKEKTAIQNQKEEILDQLLTQLAGYVESVAGDDEQLILSAGMDMRTPGVVSSSPPAPPQGVGATTGDHDGEIDLSWDPVAGAKSYVIEQSTDPAAANSWTHSGGIHAIGFHCSASQQRHTLLAARRGHQQQRAKRLERFGDEDRALGEASSPSPHGRAMTYLTHQEGSSRAARRAAR